MHYHCTIISKMRQTSEVKPWKLKFLIISNWYSGTNGLR